MALNKMNKDQLSNVKAKDLWKLGEAKIASPLLPISWAHLGTPQNNNPEYDGEYGMYRFDLVIDPSTDDGKKFIAKLESAHDHMIAYANKWAAASGSKIKFTESLNLKDEKNADKQPTGNKVLKFKQPAKRYIKKKDTVVDTPVLVVDTDGNRVPSKVLNRIGNGTKVQVMFDMRAYCMNGSLGTSVKPIKVRLVELVEYGNNIDDSEYFDEDFGKVSGSFKVADVAEEEVDEFDEYDSDVVESTVDDYDGDF